MIDIGSVINGKYRLVRLLGDGGMGAVYEAQHAMLGTRVAVKVLHPELGRRTGLVERFLQEARVAAQIRSPHVVQVTDVDRTSDGYAYIVMELLEGEPLSSVLDRQNKLPVPIACDYASQILAALEAAHALGVIHRDLKPENVFVTFAGGRPVLKLIDFGIAKARPTDVQQKKLTVAGVVMGTAEYMAPEQARSADRVDARSDLYAVGVILYEMIAGSRPVSGDDARVIAVKVERGEVVPLVQVAPDTPREIAGLVHRAMAARPELRFATAIEMRLALQSALGIKRSSTAAPLPAKASGSTVELSGGPPRAPNAASPLLGALPAARRTPAGAMESEPHVDTIRAPPIATALTPSPYGGGTPMPGPVPPPPPPPVKPHRARGATVALIALPLVLGAGLVALFVGLGSGGSSSRSAAAPLPAPDPSIASAPTTTAAEPTGGGAIRNDVPTLAPTRPTPGAPPPPHATIGGHAAVPQGGGDGGPTALGLPPGMASGLPPFPSGFPHFPDTLPSGLALPSAFPTSLPSGFPTALPSGFPTSLPSGFPTSLPSGFPSTLPGWPPPAPPAPAPSSHSGSSADPAY